jgi:hypothetical protein
VIVEVNVMPMISMNGDFLDRPFVPGRDVHKM